MVIYGTAVVAACYFAGMLIGEMLGQLLGIGTNVGGVGFAMFLLLLCTSYIMPKSRIKEGTEAGITFWQGMYIPIAIAMSASQNVIKAVSGGVLALLAGLLAVGLGMALIPLIDRLFKSSQPELDKLPGEGAQP